MEQEKGMEKIDGIKEELVEECEKDLEEIAKSTDRPLTFDEIEKLVDEKLDTARNEVIAKIVENKQEKKMRSNGEPEETSICICGTEATISRDSKGKIKIFEREIETKKGTVKMKEYGYYCTKCRKVFFPSKERA